MERKIVERSWVEIDLAAFRKNLSFLKTFLQPYQSFLQIVKADAYGHGAKEIAETALSEGAVYLGVANVEEGKLLRIQGISAPILILSPSLASETDEIVKYDLVPAVSDLDFADSLTQAAINAEQSVKIHLKIDTGMHRSGIRIEEANSFYTSILQYKNLEVEGIFSHFSSAESDPDFCHEQEKLFEAFIRNIVPKPKYIHISNSAGTINGHGKQCNLSRFGISSFGVDSIGKYHNKLSPVMTFKSILSQVKTIKTGESVGYNRDWVATSPGCYGIIPIGYADGYDFMLSGKGLVSVRGVLCPVIGRISMDMITINLSAQPEAKVGDEVELLGNQALPLRAENLSKLYGGSAYELLCQLGRRARRFYKSNDHILHSTPLARRDFIATDFGDSKLNQIISSALAKRLESEEIGELIYREILRSFFYDKDRDVHYRRNFVHKISFVDCSENGYFRVKTMLSYRKILDYNYFIVACAGSDEILRNYFMRSDVEYRWLLDSGVSINSSNFKVDSVKVNRLDMLKELRFQKGALEIHCRHVELDALRGTEVEFEICTSTLYPANIHQLSVFISELTRGIEISFEYPTELGNVEPVSIFSGQEKNPDVSREENKITIKTKPDEWVFPLSGVVFTY
ncbi:MAG: alanine racemase [Candidatus Cloacimonetes bacterium]|nr:alanine racemase [Candidatus Cloacimonadota bacterium]MDD4687866.1 alanine racemase [Candidatus Cloacimonadota bacterium]